MANNLLASKVEDWEDGHPVSLVVNKHLLDNSDEKAIFCLRHERDKEKRAKEGKELILCATLYHTFETKPGIM